MPRYLLGQIMKNKKIFISVVGNVTEIWSHLTLRLLMSYIYGAPSNARNANVVYI